VDREARGEPSFPQDPYTCNHCRPRARSLAHPLTPDRLSKFEYDGRLNPEFRAGAFSLPIARISAYVDAERPRAPRVVVLSARGAVGGLEAGGWAAVPLIIISAS
jgi:hypothetical protein